MSDYTQTTDFSAKDSLASGDPEKIILGADVDVELAAIAAAIATKFDASNDGAGSGLDADSVDGIGPFASGTYTPTLTNTTNIDSSTARTSMYVRIGSIVLVFAAAQVNPTTNGVPTQLDISLPVASDLASEYDLIGGGSSQNESNAPAGMHASADVTNNRCIFQWAAGTTGNTDMNFWFAYRVL